MRRLLPLLLAAPLLAGEFDALIAKLKDENTREGAARALVAQGTPALDDLRKAADEPALKECALAIVKEIEAKEPHGLRFHVGVPKMRLDLATVNGDAMKVAVGVVNRGKETLVLWPYFSLRILDAKGQVVGRKQHIGRWGRGRSPRWLEEVKYVKLAPGEKWAFETPLSRYLHDDRYVEGWEVPEPGTYTIEVTYRFDRAAAKKGSDPAWEKLDDGAQPWNQALELTHAFTVEMKVE